MSGFRRCGRKPLRYSIRISHQTVGDVLAETKDISETGIFVRSAVLLSILTVGETLVAELECDANTIENTQLKVVRMTEDGVGLEFE